MFNFFKPAPAAMPTIGVVIAMFATWGTPFFPLFVVGFVICFLGNLKR